MKNLFVWLFAFAFILSTATATGFVSGDIVKGKWKVLKNKKGLLIHKAALSAKDSAAKGSYCCTFSDGTKCYSSNCDFCGCSGAKPATIMKHENPIQVKLDPKRGVSIRDFSQGVAQASDGGYCCTFSDGTKCAATDCSFCGCY
ncbi:MAG: hypothetical protein AAFQ83_17385 [Bacteroidota bacterium]